MNATITLRRLRLSGPATPTGPLISGIKEGFPTPALRQPRTSGSCRTIRLLMAYNSAHSNLRPHQRRRRRAGLQLNSHQRQIVL